MLQFLLDLGTIVFKCFFKTQRTRLSLVSSETNSSPSRKKIELFRVRDDLEDLHDVELVGIFGDVGLIKSC